MLNLDLLERSDLALDLIWEPWVRAESPESETSWCTIPPEAIERIHLVTEAPPGTHALDPSRRFHFGARTLYLVADHEQHALEGLALLAQALPSSRAGIEVDLGLRPSALREAGRHLAEAWLAASELPLHVVFAARPLSFSVLSPYPEDLGSTLYALARQSAAYRPHEGWSPILDASPSRDSAALLAEHLTKQRSELLAERRAAERSIGLDLSDGSVLTHGHFRARKGVRVDPALEPLGLALELNLAASRSPALLAELARVCLEAGRLGSLTAIFESRAAPSPVFSSRVFELEDDALEHRAHASVQTISALIDRNVDSRDRWQEGSGPAGLPILLLRLARRADLTGACPTGLRVCLVGHRSWDLCRDDPREASTPLRAARLALRAQFSG